jgi:hypothetical protein
MAHEVLFNVPDRTVGKADIEFKVFNDDGRLGTLRVSKGSVVWYREHAKRGHKISWYRLGQLIEAHGNPVEKRR